jgi:hypothetical protein
VLQRCDYDVRPLFEAADFRSVPERGETMLAFAMPGGAADVEVTELDPAIFSLVSALREWTERSVFGATEADALIDELVSHGLLETRP